MRVEAADQEFDRTKPVGNEPQLGRFFLLRNSALIREAGVRRVIIPQETEQRQKGHVGRREVLFGMKLAFGIGGTERKRVVKGTSVSVRVDTGGCRLFTQQNADTRIIHNTTT